MKKFLALVLLSLLLSACAPVTRNVGNPVLSPMLDGMYDNNPILVNQRLMRIQRIIDSIYFLHTDTEFKLEDGEVITAELEGTGVLVLDRYIITVSHAVSHDSLQVEMVTPMGIQRIDVPAEKLCEETYLNLGGSRIRLEEVVKGKEDDIAIFKVPDGLQLVSFPYEIGNSDELQVGHFIYVIGNPMNYGINVREGIVSSLVAPEAIAAILPRYDNAFMISNGVNPGDSGTPVIAIRDGKYELVGLSQGIFTNAQSLSWAIKINPILRKLKNGLEEGEHPPVEGQEKVSETIHPERRSRSHPI
jgi:S1-C subfamily serine protease